MAVMGDWAFILCTRHRWQKTKEQVTMKTYPADFPRAENKEVFLFYIICVQYTKFWLELGTISIWTNCQFIWSGKVYILLSVWEFKKLCLWQPCLNIAHACWEVKYWSPSALLVCGHFTQIHSCMSICFSYIYTNNFHKWFGIFHSDNSVLMRVPHIQ